MSRCAKNTRGTIRIRKFLSFLITAGMICGMAGCSQADQAGQTAEDVQDVQDLQDVQDVQNPFVIQLPDYTQSEPSDSLLYVDKVEGIDNSFIRGVDISSYASLIDSGVTFQDWDGNLLDDVGFFTLLAEAGVNWIRIRVWNDPYDAEGNSYGGGNNDLETAIRIGKPATQAGMQVMIDFHYSDFWADPSKQKAPKEWENYNYDSKKNAITQFTKDSLQQLMDAGVNVGMVQVGNETVAGLSGETGWGSICGLLKAGCNAVREFSADTGKDILVALHFTNPDQFLDFAASMEQYHVDYDVFAASYYPYWHGKSEDLTDKLTTIAQTYDKKVIVAETSYSYTDDEGDGWSNTIHSSNAGITIAYEISQQGQANAVRDVIQAVAETGDAGLGIFYWEPAWIPVQVYDAAAPDAASVLASSREKWETYGSGWASSFAKDYDPDDAGVYYGGSSWDNQAMFDFEGNPLESLNIFKYIFSGTNAELTFLEVNNITFQSDAGEPLSMPETVPATYINGKTKEVPVTWDMAAVEKAEQAVGGTFEIEGTAQVEGKEYPLICSLEIIGVNHILNPGFEDADMSMWTISGAGVRRESDNNKRSGDYSLKFWNESKVTYTAEQEITGLPEGTYELSAFLQGGDPGSNAIFQLYITVNGKTYTADSGLSGWLVWDNPRISDIMIPADAQVTVGVNVDAAAKAWGAWDDFQLYRTGG